MSTPERTPHSRFNDYRILNAYPEDDDTPGGDEAGLPGEELIRELGLAQIRIGAAVLEAEIVVLKNDAVVSEIQRDMIAADQETEKAIRIIRQAFGP